MKKNYLLLLLFCLIGTWLSASATQKTIFFDNSSRKWTQPCAYFYGNGDAVEYQMTNLNDNIWFYTIDTGHKYVIFKKELGNESSNWDGQVGGNNNPTLDDLTLYDENATKYPNAPKLQGSWGGDNNNWTDLELTHSSGAVYKTPEQTFPSSGSVKFGLRIKKGNDQPTWLQLGQTTLSSDGQTAPLDNSGSGNSSISLTAGTKYHLEVDFSAKTVKLVLEKVTTTASVIGYIADANTWNETGVSLTDNGDGTASGQFTLYKEYFRIKVNDIEYGPAVNPTDITLGSAMDYTPQDYNSWKLATGTYNIVVDNNTKKVTVTAQASSASYRLKTSEDGWKTTIALTGNGDGTYSCTMNNPAEGLQFMVQMNGTDHFWPTSAVTYSGGEQTINLGTTEGNNITMGSGLSGEYTITLNPTAKTLTISGGEVPVDTYYVKYSSDGWNSHEMTRQSDGTYTYTMTNPSSGCELAMQDNSKKDFWTDETDVNYTGGTKSFSMKGTSSKNIKFGEGLSGDYTLTYNPTAKTLTISGTEPEAKPYYFVGDMNDWFSKEFTDPTAPQGMNKDVMNANKDKWEFTFIDEIPGKGDLGKGWYKFDFSAHGYECLTGQFQIFDGTDALWEGEVYSHNPYVSGYGNNGGKDHNSFKAYINRPISSEMISNETVMTTTTTKGGNPAIRRSQGSNFHLGCNAVRNAKIYFKPGNDPRLIVSGTPEDYYIFYSKNNKTSDADSKVTAQIVNGKPNTNNYYLPGVMYDNVALPNYINEDGTTAAHMNMDGIDLVEFDFSDEKIDDTLSSGAFTSMFNTASVGGMTLEDFKTNLRSKKLPNGISLSGRTTVYVQKIPNGFEYPAGRKYALQFIKAFSSSDKAVLTPVAASNLYFFNDAVHVHFNIDNYEKGAQEKNRFVNMYYRIYTYDENYNTVVINTDNGTKEQIHSAGKEIGLTSESSTQGLGWVALNEKKAPSDWDGTVADTGHSDLAAWNVAWVSGNPGNRKHIDSKYGNCYVQFKVETGPNASNASAANRANAEESDHGTLYIPERALIRNTPEFYTFNGKDLYVALEGGYTTTGVEDVFEDQIVEEGVDAEPIFFNLQGQRVVNPEKGMYIVVKGNKTYKVMIK